VFTYQMSTFADHVLALCEDGALYHIKNRLGPNDELPKDARILEYLMVFPSKVRVTASDGPNLFAKDGPRKAIGSARLFPSAGTNELHAEIEIDDPIVAKAIAAKAGPPTDVLSRKRGYGDGLTGKSPTESGNAYMVGYRRGRTEVSQTPKQTKFASTKRASFRTKHAKKNTRKGK